MAPADLTVVSPGSSVPTPTNDRLSIEDLAALHSAVAALERSTLAGRLSKVLGKPIELLGSTLPSSAREVVSGVVENALRTSLKVAINSLPKDGGTGHGRLHTALAAASGAVGGAFGLATLPLELPVSTTLALRSIAEIARHEGEDLSDPDVALACLQVFALGSHADGGDIGTSGYFAVRAALAKTVQEIGRLAVGASLADSTAPAVARLLSQIAARFGLVVSQKVAAGAVPVIGALGGAAVNAAFVEHFRAVARAHFTIRRLERAYGPEAIKEAYDQIKSEPGTARAA